MADEDHVNPRPLLIRLMRRMNPDARRARLEVREANIAEVDDDDPPVSGWEVHVRLISRVSERIELENPPNTSWAKGKKAMLAAPRYLFVPEAADGDQERQAALSDRPYTVHGEGFRFNISAPHIHAVCLAKLDFQKGQRVLDVGSGSGVLSAYIAYLVGKEGSVVGIDLEEPIAEFARNNIKRVIEHNHEHYKEIAADIEFEKGNIFLAPKKYDGSFDRIVCGANCKSEHLHFIQRLLKPGTGRLLTPVNSRHNFGDELVLFHRLEDTSDNQLNIEQEIISSVQFSDLKMPNAMEMLKHRVSSDLQGQLVIPESLTSQFDSDLLSISDAVQTPRAGSLKRQASQMSELLASSPMLGPCTPLKAAVTPRRSMGGSPSRGDGFGGDRFAEWGMDSWDYMRDSLAIKSPLIESLGEPDCYFQLTDSILPAHSSVLTTRCGLLKAQSESGMSDAIFEKIDTPSGIEREAMLALLHYCYTDDLVDMSAEMLMNCHHAAIYFDIPYLAQLCEMRLVKCLADLQPGDSDQSAADTELASTLLNHAVDNDCPMLRQEAIELITHLQTRHSRRNSTIQLDELDRDGLALLLHAAYDKIAAYERNIETLDRALGKK